MVIEGDDVLLYCYFSKIENYSYRIRSSNEVQFAISVVQAYNSNNFVRFFKLVRLV